jgi:penicillin-binding protein 2
MTESTRRLTSVGLLASILFVVLIGRVSLLGTVESKSLRQAGEKYLRAGNPLPATRGRILARDGRILVDNLATNVVKVDISKIPKAERTAVLGRLSELLDVPYSTIESKLVDPRNPRYEPAKIASNVRESAAVYIAERPDLFPGVVTDVTWQRVYPFGKLAAHTLGYLGPVNADDIKRQPGDLQYQNADYIGRAGIEKSFERELRGIPGEEIVTKDPVGLVVERKRTREPVPGKDVRLTIDIGLQELSESTLQQGLIAAQQNVFMRARRGAPPIAERINAKAGALVCFDVTNGEVVSSASYPTYDPAEFVEGLSLKRDAEYKDPKAKAPLINRVIEGQYPPGSTFKLFTAIAALRYGFITSNTTYNDKGVFKLPKSIESRVAKGVKTTWKNAGTPPSVFGIIDLRKAVRVSADTFFYKIGFEMHGGEYDDGIQRVAREMGLGKYTNIRLPQEARGVIPDRARQLRLAERYPTKFKKDWPLGATINVSIGQGDVLATPLQIARSYGAFANGGTVLDAKIDLEVLDRNVTDKRLSQTVTTLPAVAATTTTTTATTAITTPPTIASGPASTNALVSTTTPTLTPTTTTATTTTATSTVPPEDPTRTILGVEVPVVATLPEVASPPAVEGHVDIPDDARSTILGGLQDSLDKKQGTAVGAFSGFDLSSYPLAGKTGTAEKSGQQDYSVFVAFGPLPEPKYSCSAVIEEGGYGRQAGAMVRRMFEGIAGFTIQPVRVVTEGGAER